MKDATIVTYLHSMLNRLDGRPNARRIVVQRDFDLRQQLTSGSKFCQSDEDLASARMLHSTDIILIVCILVLLLNGRRLALDEQTPINSFILQ
ncbi:hypothetical protein ECG_06993 [Echinococcus granulosus]|uniref:Ubiquitin-like domain-containing protein n=1 Tax=Echinococcus granulosus TaxID=6210 RepID=A0A068WZD4_ECHGR|nr:hypothetical protein ECG_06993 [Echinococcus granulosus]CDS23051.1 hypothetical protein EgrG_002034800 [Echinococcus granulosus]